MKQILFSLLLLCFSGVLYGREVMYSNFTPAELKQWELPPQAVPMREGNRHFIRFSLQEKRNTGTYLTAPFPIERFKGQFLRVICRVRAFDVTKPFSNWNGIKIMVHTKDENDRPGWNQATRLWGNFDWKSVDFIFYVKDSVSKGEIQLGLQESSGTVDFADLHISVVPTKEVYPPVAELPEGFQAKYTPRALSRRRGAMSPAVYRKGDLDVLASWGANLVRWQLMTEHWREQADRDLAIFDRHLEKELDVFINQVLPDCERLGLKIALDLHYLPGGRKSDHDLVMQYEQKYAQAFIDTWRKIATRLKGEHAIWAYDLVNEPNQVNMAPYNYLKLQYDAARAIREVDPDVPIIVAANMGSAPDSFSYLSPLPLENIIYTTHMYLPGSYTHQGIPGAGGNGIFNYPGEINGIYYDREVLRSLLKPVREFQKRYGARIYVGEFSVVRWAEGGDRYLADLISIFEEYGWDWSYHAFRESKTWDVEYEGGSYKDYVKAAVPTKRQQVLQEGFKRNEVKR